MKAEKKDIVIIGAGGFGREILGLIESINKESEVWNVLGFVDDDILLKGTRIYGYPVIGTSHALLDKDCYVTIAVGAPTVKKRIVRMLKKTQVKYANLIHPTVNFLKNVTFGKGLTICAGCNITVDVELKNFSTINLNCTVGHDTVIGEYTTIYPGVNVSGNVILQEGVSLGTGSSLIQGVTIGEYSVIGAGSVVIGDIPAHVTAVGVPAKAVKNNFVAE